MPLFLRDALIAALKVSGNLRHSQLSLLGGAALDLRKKPAGLLTLQNSNLLAMPANKDLAILAGSVAEDWLVLCLVGIIAAQLGLLEMIACYR